MAQINLLKHTSSPQQQMNQWSGIAAKLMVLVVLGLLGYYGYTWFQLSKEAKAEQAVQVAIQEAKKKTASFKGVDELALRQQQLQEFATIVDKHIYWSSFFPILATSTFHGVTYSSLQADTDGTMSLVVSVKDMADLDKLLQVFNEPRVNKYFSNVRIGSLDQDFSKAQSFIKVDLRFDYSPELLRYNKQYESQ